MPEAPAPTSSPVEQPPAAPTPLESQNTPESLNATRKREVARVASNVLHRKIAETTAIDPQQQTDGQKKIASLKYLGENPGALDLTKGNPLQITVDGQVRTITQITGSDEENFLCTTTHQGAGGESVVTNTAVSISRVDVVNAQLLAEADGILSEFPQGSPERNLLELHLQAMRGNKDAIQNTEATNTLITEAAKRAGMLTSDDVRAFVDKVYPQDASGETTTVEAGKNPKREAILKAIEDVNVLSADNFVEVLQATGVQESIIVENQAATLEIKTLEEQLAAAIDPQAKEKISQDIENVKAKANLLQRAAEALANTSGIKDYFVNLENGNIDADQIKVAIEAFRNGDTTTFLVAAMPELAEKPGETPEEKAKREEKLKKLKNTGQGSFIALLLMYILDNTLKLGSQR